MSGLDHGNTDALDLIVCVARERSLAVDGVVDAAGRGAGENLDSG